MDDMHLSKPTELYGYNVSISLYINHIFIKIYLKIMSVLNFVDIIMIL